MTEIQNLIMQESKAIMNDVEVERRTLLIVVITVAFTLTAALLPLYAFVQHSN